MSNKNKNKSNKNNKNQTNSSKRIKEKKENVEVKKSTFEEFINRKWVKIAIHVISVYIWINFLVDMSTFTARGTYPNVLLSILALVTFILEWNIIRVNKK